MTGGRTAAGAGALAFGDPGAGCEGFPCTGDAGVIVAGGRGVAADAGVGGMATGTGRDGLSPGGGTAAVEVMAAGDLGVACTVVDAEAFCADTGSGGAEATLEAGGAGDEEVCACGTTVAGCDALSLAGGTGAVTAAAVMGFGAIVSDVDAAGSADGGLAIGAMVPDACSDGEVTACTGGTEGVDGGAFVTAGTAVPGACVCTGFFFAG